MVYPSVEQRLGERRSFLYNRVHHRRRGLPHSKQHAFNRDVDQSARGHILWFRTRDLWFRLAHPGEQQDREPAR